MAREKLRLVSLSVEGGGLDGRSYEPEEVVGEILVGSDASCHLVLDLPSISPIHVRVWADLDASKVQDTHALRGLYVNRERVQGEVPLADGDVIWLGPPDDPESVCLKPRFEPWVEKLPFAAGDAAAAEDPFFVGDPGEAASTAEPMPPPAPADDEAPIPISVTDDAWVLDSDPGGPPAAEAPAAEAQPEEAAAPAAVDDFFVAEPSADESAAPVLDVEPLPEPPAAPAAPPTPPPSRPAAAAEAPPVARAAPRPSVPPAVAKVVPRASPAPVAPRAVAAGPVAPQPGRPAAVPRRPAAPARGGPRRSGGRLRVVAALGGCLVPASAAGVFLWWRSVAQAVRVDAVSPARLRVGQRATLTGSGFAQDPSAGRVLFDGKSAKVLSAASTRLEVEVPAAVAEAGSERRVSVVVGNAGRTSAPFAVTVMQGPRLHGLSPVAAMPGEEVLLAGAGWGLGAVVRFGGQEARVLEADATRIRALVPALTAPPGTSAPVVVTVGGVESNSAPFVVGHLPLVTAVSPASAEPGDVVHVSGLGFDANPLRDEVRIAGAPALVVTAAADTLDVVVPRVAAGDPTRSLEVRIPASTSVGQGTLTVPPPADTVAPRFVAEPFTAVPDRPHAVLATGIGPAFVLAAAGGRSAAERALQAQNRLNGALTLVRSAPDLTFEARGFESTPVIGVANRPDVVIEVTAEDAAAYDEDWSGLKGRGGAVTSGRLARWWEALARDLVLLTVREERPRFAAALAPEGRVLGQLFDVARRSGRPGVPQQAVADAKPPLRDGLRLLALRVPAGVTAPVVALATPAAAALVPVAATPPPPRLQLEGVYRGTETEQGERRFVTVTFTPDGGGKIAYEGGLTVSVPFASLEAQGRDRVRFSVRIRGGIRTYDGKWDGQKLAGSVSTDDAGREVVASFELRR